MIIDTSKLRNVYDQLIKNIIPRVSPIDWMLVKAVITQESAFNPVATSVSGARGLMQIMPKTDEWLDNQNDGFDIYGNIEDGYHYLIYLHSFWTTRGIPDDEVTKFILGSYNAGQGSIEKVQAILKAKGLGYDKWEDIKKFLENVTGPDNARQTVDYVDKVLAYYVAYKEGG